MSQSVVSILYMYFVCATSPISTIRSQMIEPHHRFARTQYNSNVIAFTRESYSNVDVMYLQCRYSTAEFCTARYTAARLSEKKVQMLFSPLTFLICCIYFHFSRAFKVQKLFQIRLFILFIYYYNVCFSFFCVCDRILWFV